MLWGLDSETQDRVIEIGHETDYNDGDRETILAVRAELAHEESDRLMQEGFGSVSDAVSGLYERMRELSERSEYSEDSEGDDSANAQLLADMLDQQREYYDEQRDAAEMQTSALSELGDVVVEALDELCYSITDDFETQTYELKRGLKKLRKQAAAHHASAHKQRKKTRKELRKGFQVLKGGLDEVSQTLTKTNKGLTLGFDQLSLGLSGLQADFNIRLGEVVWQAQVQNQSLRDIVTILEAPLNTQARELKTRGMQAYTRGWYTESLADLENAAAMNYADFTVHQTIGNLYLFRLPNPEKAAQSFMRAAKYATPHNTKLASEAHYYAAVSFLACGEPEAAIRELKMALRLNPTFGEAWYRLAELYSNIELKKQATDAFKQSLLLDARYFFKAHSNKLQLDFSDVASWLFSANTSGAHKVRTTLINAFLPASETDARYMREELEDLLANLSRLEQPSTRFTDLGIDRVEGVAGLPVVSSALYDTDYKRLKIRGRKTHRMLHAKVTTSTGHSKGWIIDGIEHGVYCKHFKDGGSGQCSDPVRFRCHGELSEGVATLKIDCRICSCGNVTFERYGPQVPPKGHENHVTGLRATLTAKFLVASPVACKTLEAFDLFLRTGHGIHMKTYKKSPGGFVNPFAQLAQMIKD